jgi:hypothetical protein
MPDTDFYDALVALRDVGVREPAIADVDAHCRTALQREIEREQAHGPRRRRRRRMRRAVVVPLVVTIVGALGAVGYAALTTSSTSSAGVDCHADGRLDGSATITHLDDRVATERCASLWAQGAVVDGVHAAPASLRACVASDGKGPIHVFATADANVCASVGLREDPLAGADPAARAYGRFAGAITRQLDSPAYTCPTAAQARELIVRELREHGLTGWSIADRGGYGAQQPCASLTLNSDQQTVTITPVPR